MSYERQYSREDVEYTTWYSDWSKNLARDSTRTELERRLYGAGADTERLTRSHLRAVEASTSMQSQSQRRAQTGNVVAANGEYKMALRGALEIYELFPEYTKGEG